MKSHVIGFVVALTLATGARETSLVGQSQSTADTAQSHVGAARAAAGQEHIALFDRLCAETLLPPTVPVPSDHAAWYAEPVKVFDNLYFVGMREFSAWAVTTSDGIILIDAIFDYSVEDEVVGGLRKLGLDPTTIKYVLVSHGHIDHAGGAKHLQDRFGARVILSEADWDLLARNTQEWPKPRRDLVATDGQKLTLGDTTLTLYLTPGHTPGTISTLIPVKDRGRPHLVATWGGTAFNFARTSAQSEARRWFQAYGDSARRFRDIVTNIRADVLLSNHTNYDGSKTKLPLLASRKPGEPHPYVIGNESVQRYLTVAEECAKATLLRLR